MENKDDRKAALEAVLAQMVDALCESARAQLDYSETHNLPRGILKDSDLVDNALERGLVSAVQILAGYGVDETIRIAGHLLEDSNCHSEAAALRAAALATA